MIHVYEIKRGELFEKKIPHFSKELFYGTIIALRKEENESGRQKLTKLEREE